MSRKTTIYDIARTTDLSPSTVSRALNGSSLITPLVRRQVLKSAQELGYEKRPIKKQKSRAIVSIKLVLPYRQEQYQNLFYDPAELIAGIQRGAKPTRLHLVTELERSIAASSDYKKGGPIEGVIFAFTKPPAQIYRYLNRQGICHLTLNRILSDQDYITCDNTQGLIDLVLAIEKIRRPFKPCFIKMPIVADVARAREEGFIQGCRAVGFADPQNHIYSIKGLENLDQGFIQNLAGNRYTAVFCFNDILAAYFYQVAKKWGLSIPGDLILAGFDNSPLLKLLDFRPYTVGLSVKAIGEQAGRWISSKIVHRESRRVQKRIRGVLYEGDVH